MRRRLWYTAEMIGRTLGTFASVSMIEATVSSWWRVIFSARARSSHSGFQARSKRSTMASTVSRAVVAGGNKYVSGKRYPSSVGTGTPSRRNVDESVIAVATDSDGTFSAFLTRSV